MNNYQLAKLSNYKMTPCSPASTFRIFPLRPCSAPNGTCRRVPLQSLKVNLRWKKSLPSMKRQRPLASCPVTPKLKPNSAPNSCCGHDLHCRKLPCMLRYSTAPSHFPPVEKTPPD